MGTVSYNPQNEPIQDSQPLDFNTKIYDRANLDKTNDKKSVYGVLGQATYGAPGALENKASLRDIVQMFKDHALPTDEESKATRLQNVTHINAKIERHNTKLEKDIGYQFARFFGLVADKKIEKIDYGKAEKTYTAAVEKRVQMDKELQGEITKLENELGYTIEANFDPPTTKMYYNMNMDEGDFKKTLLGDPGNLSPLGLKYCLLMMMKTGDTSASLLIGPHSSVQSQMKGVGVKLQIYEPSDGTVGISYNNKHQAKKTGSKEEMNERIKIPPGNQQTIDFPEGGVKMTLNLQKLPDNEG